MAATSTPRGVGLLPTTAAGRGALAVFGLAAALLIARIAHIPLLNYLVVLSAAALSGVAAVIAVVRGERSVVVWFVLAIGLLAGAVLLLETIKPPG